MKIIIRYINDSAGEDGKEITHSNNIVKELVG